MWGDPRHPFSPGVDAGSLAWHPGGFWNEQKNSNLTAIHLVRYLFTLVFT